MVLFSFNFIPFVFLMFYLEKVLFVVFGANKTLVYILKLALIFVTYEWGKCCVAVTDSSLSSEEMDEIRRRAQSVLSISGSAQDVKTEVLTMANTSLPLSEKYQHLEVETILRENTEGNGSQEVKVHSCHKISVCTFSNQCHISPLEGTKHQDSDR